jgi:beta-1,4-N-acetylglucosaminyltransferase
MIDSIDLSKFANRTWVYTSGDAMSIEKARIYERESSQSYQFVEVPRARKVGEGLLSTIKSSFISARSCVNLLLTAPDLVS